MSPTSRLQELGLELPPVASPAGSYVPATHTGALVFTAGPLPLSAGQRPSPGPAGATPQTCALVFTAGQLPFAGGELHRTGKVGDAVSLEEAQECARLCV